MNTSVSPNLKSEIIYENVDLKPLCSFKIGGTSRWLAKPRTVTDLWQVLDLVSANNLKMAIIGAGTNILFDDQNFDGLIISLSELESDITTIDHSRFIVSAGQKLSTFVAFCRKKKCFCFDPLLFIPGTIGGAIVNNAGANGLCLADCVQWVEGINLHTRLFQRLSKEQISFAYRSCSLRGNFIVTKAMLKIPLKSVSCDLKAVAQYRRRHQPYQAKSAGCVFKNPQNDSAGRLIEAAGCKNMCYGEAYVSEKHANFIINKGQCTAADIKSLICMIEQAVAVKFNIKLQRELQFLTETIL